MEAAVDRYEIPGRISTVLPHPHLAGQAFLALQANAECDHCKLPNTVYALQRRFRPWANGTTDPLWAWQSMRLLDAESFEFREVNDLDWGNDGTDTTMRNLYIGTAGGGLWEATLWW